MLYRRALSIFLFSLALGFRSKASKQAKKHMHVAPVVSPRLGIFPRPSFSLMPVYGARGQKTFSFGLGRRVRIKKHIWSKSKQSASGIGLILSPV